MAEGARWGRREPCPSMERYSVDDEREDEPRCRKEKRPSGGARDSGSEVAFGAGRAPKRCAIFPHRDGNVCGAVTIGLRKCGKTARSAGAEHPQNFLIALPDTLKTV